MLEDRCLDDGNAGINVRNSMFDVWNARIVVSRKMLDVRNAGIDIRN